LKGHYCKRKQIGKNQYRNILCNLKEKEDNLHDTTVVVYEEELN